jgi:ABC-type transport system involved in multi-copper enzyme maturation permease subunit
MVLLAASLALVLGSGHLLGPVLHCELLRCGRRDRYVLFRCLYATLLLGVLGWAYLSWFADRGASARDLLWGEGVLAPTDLPKFAGRFFTAFLTAQLVVVLLLTPVYVAGAVAEERERRTLEFLLATDLSPGEIVVSKLSARLLNLALLLLTGLPVLALTQLWGGVDPLRVAGGFAAVGLTMLSVGGLSMFNSATARQPLDAVLYTYAWLVLCLLLGCIPGLSIGHPLLFVFNLANADDAGAIGFLLGYALVHLLAAFLLVNLAIARLRQAPFASVGAAEPEPAPSVVPGETPAPLRPLQPHPPVADRPLLWKELYAAPRLRWDHVHAVLLALLLVVAVSAGLLALTLVLVGLTDDVSLAEPLNLWVRCVGTPLAGLLLFVTAFYAAGTVSRERERHTLDGLLTLPDGREAVLAAKWQGAVLSARSAWLYLGAVWGLGVVTGGLHLAAVPTLAAGFAVYTAFVASLGLFCSTVCRSTLRATMATILVLVAVVGGSWLLWWGSDILFAGASREVRWWAEAVLQDGLAPPMPLWVLAFRYDEMSPAGGGEGYRMLAAALGLLVYGLADWVLWRLALARFRAEAGPAPRR